MAEEIAAFGAGAVLGYLITKDGKQKIPVVMPSTLPPEHILQDLQGQNYQVALQTGTFIQARDRISFAVSDSLSLSDGYFASGYITNEGTASFAVKLSRWDQQDSFSKTVDAGRALRFKNLPVNKITITAATGTYSSFVGGWKPANQSDFMKGISESEITVVDLTLPVRIDINAQSLSSLNVNISASSVTLNVNISSQSANLNVNIAAQTIGNLNINIAAQTLGTLAVNLANVTTTAALNVVIASQSVTLNVNISSQSASVNVSLVASSITLNTQGTVPITIGGTVYQSLPVSIVAEQIGNLNVNIAAQTVGNLNVNIAAQSVGNLNVNIAAQSATVLNVNLSSQSGNISVNIAAQGLAQLNVNLAASAITLNVNISSSAVTLNVNISSTSANLNVNLNASAITLNISLHAQDLTAILVGNQTGSLTPDAPAFYSGSATVVSSVASTTISVNPSKTGNCLILVTVNPATLTNYWVAAGVNMSATLAGNALTLIEGKTSTANLSVSTEYAAALFKGTVAATGAQNFVITWGSNFDPGANSVVVTVYLLVSSNSFMVGSITDCDSVQGHGTVGDASTFTITGIKYLTKLSTYFLIPSGGPSSTKQANPNFTENVTDVNGNILGSATVNTALPVNTVISNIIENVNTFQLTLSGGAIGAGTGIWSLCAVNQFYGVD